MRAAARIALALSVPNHQTLAQIEPTHEKNNARHLKPSRARIQCPDPNRSHREIHIPTVRTRKKVVHFAQSAQFVCVACRTLRCNCRRHLFEPVVMTTEVE